MGILYNIADDPHRSNPYAHWRLYHPRKGSIRPVEMQAYDYGHYDPNRFVTTLSFNTEQEAWHAIDTLKDEARRILE